MSRWSSRRFLGVLLGSLGLLGAERVEAQPEPVAQAIAAIVREACHSWLRWPCFPNYQDELQGIYVARGHAPLWIENARPTQQAAAAIEALADSARSGLDPGDYDAALLERTRLAFASGEPASPEDLARFDAALSIDVLRHISDLHVGKLNPRNVSFGLDAWPHTIELVTRLPAAVQAGRIRELIEEAQPGHAMYQRLLGSLADYRALEADASLRPLQLATPLRDGDTTDAGPDLARTLRALRDLPAEAPVEEGRYAGELVAALKRFQERHGLDPDGIIGPLTARALAVPLSARRRQIELSLERLRWIPDLPPARFVIVNIPAFELLVRESLAEPGDSALSMRVVVGEAGRTPTPVFIAAMREVVFRPYWDVPRSISDAEMLPKIQRDPGYLAAQQLELVGREDPAVLPETPESVERLAAGTARLRQRPGPDNPLGNVKFLFPNHHDVYIHDTPSRERFQSSRRDFSHGCIRVQDPLGLAAWVLRDQPEWGPDAIQAELTGEGEPLRVPVRDPILVIVFYTTVIARSDGRVFFYDDIYGHDERLAQALAAEGPPL